MNIQQFNPVFKSLKEDSFGKENCLVSISGEENSIELSNAGQLPIGTLKRKIKDGEYEINSLVSGSILTMRQAVSIGKGEMVKIYSGGLVVPIDYNEENEVIVGKKISQGTGVVGMEIQVFVWLQNLQISNTGGYY